MKLNKLLKLLACSGLALSFAACSSADTGTETADDATAQEQTDDAAAAEEKEEEKTDDVEKTESEGNELTGTYSYHVGGYDWGAGTDKVTIELSAPVDEVSTDTFTVEETKMATDYAQEGMPVLEQTFTRTVENAALVKKDGTPADGASQYVALDLYVSPNDGSPINYDPSVGTNSWSEIYDLSITLAEGAELSSEGEAVTAITIDKTATGKTTDADPFQTDTWTATDGTKYDYAYYVPEEDTSTLFVWLHGGGEGQAENSDPYVVALANKVTAYVSDEFQNTLGGAQVLVPQCPTLWMDNGEEGDLLEISNDKSLYTESLHEFIEHYASENGIDKIVLSGCSNGGFMTVNMAYTYGDEYTAFVPICEGLIDTAITDEHVQAMKDLPMYFIYSKADDTLAPEKYSEPLLAALEEAGASKLEKSVSEKVIDTSGKYTDEEGNPHEYSGHWSWIYFDNNEADTEDGLKVWDWIAAQLQ